MIQHKLDIYAAGLEHNPAAGIDLAESRKAFSRYLVKLDTLSPNEERTVVDLRAPDDTEDAKTAGGIYAIAKDQVRLFTLGSVSRGIPYKEWVIPHPIPINTQENYGFYPGADIIAFVELPKLMCVYYIRDQSRRCELILT